MTADTSPAVNVHAFAGADGNVSDDVDPPVADALEPTVDPLDEDDDELEPPQLVRATSATAMLISFGPRTVRTVAVPLSRIA